MHDIPRFARRALVPLAAVALIAGCGDRKAQVSADSSLAQDLTMAQRPGTGPVVFNDAPIGASMPSPAPAPRPEPPRVSTPRPRPAPRRNNPPAEVAQAPAPTPPEPAPAPAPAAGNIGAGTSVGMTMNGRVCAATALAGDKFTATVDHAIEGSNGASIAAGSTVVLEVASVEHADPIESSKIHFRVRAIDVNGSPQPADGDVATLGTLEKVPAPGSNDRTKVIGGAVAGAVLGQIFGRSTKSTIIGAAAGAAAGTVAARASRGAGDACLPTGSALRFTTSHDIVVRHDGTS